MSNKKWTKHQKSGAYQTQSLIFQFLASCKLMMTELKMNQRGLADKLGCSRAQVSQWMREDANVTLATVGKVMAALGVRDVKLVMQSEHCENVRIESNKFSSGGLFAIPCSSTETRAEAYALGSRWGRNVVTTHAPIEAMFYGEAEDTVHPFHRGRAYQRHESSQFGLSLPLPHVIKESLTT